MKRILFFSLTVMLILTVALAGCGGGSGGGGGKKGDDDSRNVATTTCFVYAACYETGEIRAFMVNNDGTLSLIGTYRRTEPAEPGRHLGKFTPKHLVATSRYVYVTNSSDNTISTFAINKGSGALQLIQDVIKSESSNGVAVTSNNKYLYLASLHNIIAYQMNSDGTLITENKEAKVIYTSDTLQQPFSIAKNQNEKYLYMGDAAANTISVFSIPGTDGKLSLIGTPLNINYPSAITSNNQFVYVTNRSDDKVFAYTISDNGSLQANSFSESIDTGFNPCAITIDPNGRYVFVLNKGDLMTLESTISIYAINQNGSLTKKADIPNDIASGMNSLDLAIDPDGRYLFVTNRGITNPPASDTNITSFTINQNGSLTKVGTYNLGVSSDHIVCVGTP